MWVIPADDRNLEGSGTFAVLGLDGLKDQSQVARLANTVNVVVFMILISFCVGICFIRPDLPSREPHNRLVVQANSLRSL